MKDSIVQEKKSLCLKGATMQTVILVKTIEGFVTMFWFRIMKLLQIALSRA